MTVRVTNIAGELNFYTGAPQGNPRTVAFPLVRSVDSTQMSNATVMLFPSFGKPEFQMSILLKNGNVKSFKQTLNAPLTANSKLTLTLTLGDIFSEEVIPESSPGQLERGEPDNRCPYTGLNKAIRTARLNHNGTMFRDMTSPSPVPCLNVCKHGFSRKSAIRLF